MILIITRQILSKTYGIDNAIAIYNNDWIKKKKTIIYFVISINMTQLSQVMNT